MFDSLTDRIRQDEQKNTKEQIFRILLTLVIAVLIFGGLYLVVQHLE